MAESYKLLDRVIVRSGELALTDQVYDALRLEIQAGRWQVGDRLPGISTLAGQSGIGRQVLQSTFERLGKAGYVELRGRSGTYLVSMCPAGQTPLGSIGVLLARSDALPDTLRDLYRLHTLLECLAGRGWLAQTYYLDAAADLVHIRSDEGPFGQRVQGILSLCPFPTEDAVELPDGQLPVVFLSNLCRGCAPLVAEDTLFAFRALTRLVVRNGHRHILPLAVNGDAYPDLEDRFRGVAQALAEAGLAPDEAAFRASLRINADDGVALRGWLQRTPRATAVVCLTAEADDTLVELANDAGIRIPADLSITMAGSHPLDGLGRGRLSAGAVYDWNLSVATGLDLLLQIAKTHRTETSGILLRPRICAGDTIAAPRRAPELEWQGCASSNEPTGPAEMPKTGSRQP